MDVLNEKDLHDKVVAPAIDQAAERLQSGIIPALEAVIQRQLTAVVEDIHGALGNTIDQAQRTLMLVEGKAVADLSGLIASLDGWTLEIKVRLSKPDVV